MRHLCGKVSNTLLKSKIPTSTWCQQSSCASVCHVLSAGVGLGFTRVSLAEPVVGVRQDLVFTEVIAYLRAYDVLHYLADYDCDGHRMVVNWVITWSFLEDEHHPCVLPCAREYTSIENLFEKGNNGWAEVIPKFLQNSVWNLVRDCCFLWFRFCKSLRTPGSNTSTGQIGGYCGLWSIMSTSGVMLSVKTELNWSRRSWAWSVDPVDILPACMFEGSLGGMLELKVVVPLLSLLLGLLVQAILLLTHLQQWRQPREVEALGDRLHRDVLLTLTLILTHGFLDGRLKFFPALFHVVVCGIIQDFVAEVSCSGSHGHPVHLGPERNLVKSFVDMCAQVEIRNNDSAEVGNSRDGFQQYRFRCTEHLHNLSLACRLPLELG